MGVIWPPFRESSFALVVTALSWLSASILPTHQSCLPVFRRARPLQHRRLQWRHLWHSISRSLEAVSARCRCQPTGSLISHCYRRKHINARSLPSEQTDRTVHEARTRRPKCKAVPFFTMHGVSLSFAVGFCSTQRRQFLFMMSIKIDKWPYFDPSRHQVLNRAVALLIDLTMCNMTYPGHKLAFTWDQISDLPFEIIECIIQCALTKRTWWLLFFPSYISKSYASKPFSEKNSHFFLWWRLNFNLNMVINLSGLRHWLPIAVFGFDLARITLEMSSNFSENANSWQIWSFWSLVASILT